MSFEYGAHQDLQRMLDAQLSVFPQHHAFLKRRLSPLSASDLDVLNNIATHVRKLAGENLQTYVADYAWLCQEQMVEELDFRRSGRYRLNTFAEAYEQVYSNKEYMTRYMNGLLITQLWWANHTAVMDYYRSVFLANQKPGYSHLEIGPGHGLFLYFAASDPKAGSVTGWDISQASIELTKEALETLGLEELPTLRLQNFFDSPQEKFDSVVFSEVLEHMEHPREALEYIRPLLSENGRLFLNMPINSPAPDHLFNMDTPEDLYAFVESAGYQIVDHAYYPATNQTLEASRRKRLTISCAFIATTR
jgi:2-polyprenyl-3-methyl-5-hydroxy-6-metoxy-1,4-benzoquinol methylase